MYGCQQASTSFIGMTNKVTLHVTGDLYIQMCMEVWFFGLDYTNVYNFTKSLMNETVIEPTCTAMVKSQLFQCFISFCQMLLW